MNMFKNIVPPKPGISQQGGWIMSQSWENVLFMHWPISAKLLQTHIPKELTIDTYDGTAWLGIVLFSTNGVYLRGMPSISLLPICPEINVRTYVKYNGKPGVYFLSLDVSNWVLYTIAKHWFHLSYFPANISSQKIKNIFHFESKRIKSKKEIIQFDCKFETNSNDYLAKEDTLEHWLTEKYCFFSNDQKGNIYRCDIDHTQWTLQNVDLTISINTMCTPLNFRLPNTSPITHFSPGVETILWNIKKI
ncbi:YqjF family protein [Bacillus sp. AFS017336]|uniref:YqjF family protein n=1 Tax=Bacillus sp. AFS017336 TaxID=2033489 RepID=UPI00211D3EDD|nr:DUF2071 domain-containing protein [Bacillus sp. AFS017336]